MTKKFWILGLLTMNGYHACMHSWPAADVDAAGPEVDSKLVVEALLSAELVGDDIFFFWHGGDARACSQPHKWVANAHLSLRL